MIAALILAAGKSERMGSPKALLRYQGRTFLQRILDVVEACPGIDIRMIVAGLHAREIAAAAGTVRVVFNPDYVQGMTTSFQAGIRALPSDVDGIIVFLVDHPIVEASTVQAILERAEDGAVVLPVYRGRRGHPVFFSRAVMEEITSLPVTLGVNSVVRSDPARVIEVAVEDRGILADIDTPQDYARLIDEKRG